MTVAVRTHHIEFILSWTFGRLKNVPSFHGFHEYYRKTYSIGTWPRAFFWLVLTRVVSPSPFQPSFTVLSKQDNGSVSSYQLQTMSRS